MFFECLLFQPRLLRRKRDHDATRQSLWTSRFVQLASGKSFIEKAQKIKRIKIEVIWLHLEKLFLPQTLSHRPTRISTEHITILAKVKVVVQKLMRHASFRTTMDSYTQASGRIKAPSAEAPSRRDYAKLCRQARSVTHDCCGIIARISVSC